MLREQLIDAFANAIAFAEGYYVTGSRASRNNNPGNLTVDLTGKAISKDGTFVVYATILDGWEALKKQAAMIIDNTSQIYNSGMTLMEIAQRYTTTEQTAWATNVASRLGIPVDVPISSLLSKNVVVDVGFLLMLIGFWYWYSKQH